MLYLFKVVGEGYFRDENNKQLKPFEFEFKIDSVVLKSYAVTKGFIDGETNPLAYANSFIKSKLIDKALKKKDYRFKGAKLLEIVDMQRVGEEAKDEIEKEIDEMDINELEIYCLQNALLVEPQSCTNINAARRLVKDAEENKKLGNNSIEEDIEEEQIDEIISDSIDD